MSRPMGSPTTPPRPRHGSFGTTADVGIWATGPTPERLFAELGAGLFAVMTDLRKVRPTQARSVVAAGSDPVALLVAYLNELVALASDGFAVREVRVDALGSPPSELRATAVGEPFDPDRHPRRVEVKAVTLHGAELDLVGGRARVILDI